MFQLHPESETKFFLEEVDAQIEFFVIETVELEKWCCTREESKLKDLKNK